MNACPYCRTLNDAKAERCSRCGHRSATARVGVSSGSTAAVMQLVPDPVKHDGQVAVAESSVSEKPSRRSATQPSLFREAMPAQKVVPIPMLTPLHLPERERTARRGGGRTAPQTPSRTRRVSEAQQALDWGQSVSQARPEEKISCNAPVAPNELRLTSTVADGATVVFGTSIILGIYYWQGGEVVFGTGGLMMLGLMMAVVSGLYRALWCLADGDTPGMQFAGLRLVDFDGRHPGRQQRMIRQVASILSYGAAGVGIAWALVDDEGLTWHDHISKTFPTPAARRQA